MIRTGSRPTLLPMDAALHKLDYYLNVLRVSAALAPAENSSASTTVTGRAESMAPESALPSPPASTARMLDTEITELRKRCTELNDVCVQLRDHNARCAPSPPMSFSWLLSASRHNWAQLLSFGCFSDLTRRCTRCVPSFARNIMRCDFCAAVGTRCCCCA